MTVFVLFFNYTLGGLPIPVNRFAGTDKSGLLYIGRASRQTLQKRVYNFLATARAEALTTNHPGGLKYRTIDTVRNVLGQHALYFDVEPCNDSVVREAEQLNSYRQQFGEYPPLNK